MGKRAETDDGARMGADLESFLNEHLNDGSRGWPRLRHHPQAKPDDSTLSAIRRLRIEIVGDMLRIGTYDAVLTIRRLSSSSGSDDHARLRPGVAAATEGVGGLRRCSDELDAA